MTKLDCIGATINNKYSLPPVSSPKARDIIQGLEQLVSEAEGPPVAGFNEDGNVVFRALASAKVGKEVSLSAAEEKVAKALEEHLEAGMRALDAPEGPPAWPPPPPKAERSQAAVNGRVPLVGSLKEVQKDARSGLGASEVAPYSTLCRSSSLQSLLRASKTNLLWSSGDESLEVTGVTDDPSLVGSGDLLVVSWEGVEAAREVALQAWQSGAAAVAFCGELPSGDGFRGDSVLGGGRGPVVAVSGADAAGRLARAFFGDPAARLQIALVAGSDAVEVRTASWLLTHILEAQHGARRTALLSSRRTLVGYRALDLDRTLSACTVQELLADMVDSGVGTCVVEALPGALHRGAFRGVEFCCAVDLDAETLSSSEQAATSRGAEAVRDVLDQALSSGPVLRNAAPGESLKPLASGQPSAFALRGLLRMDRLPRPLGNAPDEQIMNILRYKGHYTPGMDVKEACRRILRLQGLGQQHEYKLAKRLEKKALAKTFHWNKVELRRRLAVRGVEVSPATKRWDMRLMLSELMLREWAAGKEIDDIGDKEAAEEEEEDEEVDEDGDDEEGVVEEEEELGPGLLRGLVHDSTTPWRLDLGLERVGTPAAKVSLPLLGAGAARAAAAACCVGLAMARQSPAAGSQALTDEDLLQQVASAMEAAPPPPGAMEVLVASNIGGFSSDDFGNLPRCVVVLHDLGRAPDPKELRRSLGAVRAWLGLREAQSTLTAVFGSPGEMMRGDRAKCGWALADLCDRVVLTSSHPRSEPPMQILEDILEAMRARAPGAPRRLGEPRQGPGGAPMPLCSDLEEVHVVADRADALKLAVLAHEPPNREYGSVNFVVVFGQAHQDTQEVPDEKGTVRRWLCNDRRVIMEAFEHAESLELATIKDLGNRSHKLMIGRVPWGRENLRNPLARRSRTILTLPGRSLHWSYDRHVKSDGEVQAPL